MALRKQILFHQQPLVAGKLDMSALSGVTVEELSARVQRFRAQNIDSLTDQELLQDVYGIVVPTEGLGMTFNKSSRPVAAGTNFFRGRRLSDMEAQLQNTRDIWEPKPDIVKGSGRFHGSGESILYTSINTPITAFWECRFGVSDLFAMSRYEAKQDFDVTVVGMDPRGADLDAETAAKVAVIQDFLDETFSSRAGDSNPNAYRLSRLLVLQFWDLPPKLYKGWTYRSTVDPIGEGWNVAFRPELGHKVLRYKSTQVYRLVKITEEHVPLTEFLGAFKPARGERLYRVPDDKMADAGLFAV